MIIFNNDNFIKVLFVLVIKIFVINRIVYQQSADEIVFLQFRGFIKKKHYLIRCFDVNMKIFNKNVISYYSCVTEN